MPASNLNLPGDFEAGKSYLVKAETLLAWRRALIEDRAIPGDGLAETQTPQGRIISFEKIGLLGGAGGAACSFGEIFQVEGDTHIRGGNLYAGDSNKLVAPLAIDVGTDSESLIWLRVPITANTEDGVLMPHLESCEDPTWQTGTVAGGYPDNTSPDIDTGEGVRIVPLGLLTIVAGEASFQPTGCGDITLGFCPPNNLSIARG